MLKLGEIKAAADAGFRDDMTPERGNAAGEALSMSGVGALMAQTREIERAAATLELTPIAFKGSDSRDNPSAVFQ